MPQERFNYGADIFSNGSRFAGPFAGTMPPGTATLPRLDAMAPMVAPMMMAPGFEAVIKGVARWNLELVGLMSRRAQAYLEIPARLSQCRTPNDVLREQTQFVRTAVEQYMDSSRRLTGVATQMMAGASASGTATAKPRQRDYINVPGLDEQTPGSSGGGGHRPRGERRVA